MKEKEVQRCKNRGGGGQEPEWRNVGQFSREGILTSPYNSNGKKKKFSSHFPSPRRNYGNDLKIRRGRGGQAVDPT